MECSFCKELERLKDDDKYYTKQSKKNGRKNIDDYETKYDIALISNTYYKGEHSGRVSYYGHTLRFCPTCGKELEK